MRRIAKTSRAAVIRILDRLWGCSIRRRYQKCVVCGSTSGLSAHHCIVRKARTFGVRWMEWNGVALCYVCHMHKVHGNQSDATWHEMYLGILHGLIPSDKWDEVVQMGNRLTKYSVDDLRELVDKGWWNNGTGK